MNIVKLLDQRNRASSSVKMCITFDFSILCYTSLWSQMMFLLTNNYITEKYWKIRKWQNSQ